MKGDKFSSTLLGDQMSRSKPSRITISGNQQIISIVIKNTSRSGQTLWMGINTNDLIEPIEPGQSVAIASREGAYIDETSINLGWDDPTNSDERVAIQTTGKDTGEIKC